MLKAIVFEFENVLIDLNPYLTKTWQKIFSDINSKFQISELMIKKLLELNGSDKKILFLNELKTKYAMYPEIKNMLVFNLLKIFDKTLLQVLETELGDDSLNLNLLNNLVAIQKEYNLDFLILNTTPLANWIFKKLNFFKKYPFFKPCFKKEQINNETFLENEQNNFKTIDDFLDFLARYNYQNFEIIMVAYKQNLVYLARKSECFVVSTNSLQSSIASISFNLKNEDIDLNKTIFEYYAKN